MFSSTLVVAYLAGRSFARSLGARLAPRHRLEIFRALRATGQLGSWRALVADLRSESVRKEPPPGAGDATRMSGRGRTCGILRQRSSVTLSIVDVAGRRPRSLRPFIVGALREAHVVETAPTSGRPDEMASLLTALATAGVPLAGDIDEVTRLHLPEGVVSLVVDRVVDRPGVAGEYGAVRLQRAARRLDRAEDRQHVSVLLATNRPDDVVSAVEMIEGQRDVAVELLVGLHGPDFPEHVVERIAQASVDAVDVVRFEQQVLFGDVLNALSERVTAPFVAKWDDDDWYGRYHLDDTVAALDATSSELAGKAAEFVYLEAQDMTIRRTSSGSERLSGALAGGTLVLRRDALDSVRWRSVPRHVDRHLIDDILAAGGRTYRTHGFGYVLRRRGPGGGHTWAAPDEYFERSAEERRCGLDLEFAGVEQ